MVVHVTLLDHVEVIDHAVHLVIELGAERLYHVVDAVEAARIRGRSARPDPRAPPAPLVKGKLHANRYVEETRVGGQETLPRNGGLHAPYDAVVPGVLYGIAVLHQRGYYRPVVEEGGHTVTLPGDVQRPLEVPRRRALMNAGLVVRVPHAVAIHHVEHDVGERVGGVFTPRVGAAHDSGLYDQEPPVVLRHSLGEEHHVLRRLRAEEQHQLKRLLAGEAAIVDILLIVRVQVLVYAAERDRGVQA